MSELTGEPRVQFRIPSPGALSIIFATAATKGFSLWGDEGTTMKKLQPPNRNDNTTQPELVSGRDIRNYDLLLLCSSQP